MLARLNTLRLAGWLSLALVPAAAFAAGSKSKDCCSKPAAAACCKAKAQCCEAKKDCCKAAKSCCDAKNGPKACCDSHGKAGGKSKGRG